MPDSGSTRTSRYPFTRSNTPVEPAARDSVRREPTMHDPIVRDPANDPLTELARLIGQRDPFAEPAREHVRREPIAPQMYEPLRHDSADDPIPEEARNHLRDILAGRRNEEWPGSPEPSYQDFDGPAPLAPDDQDDLFARRPVDDPAYNGEEFDQPPIYTPPSDYGQVEPEPPLYGDNGQLMRDDGYSAEPLPQDHYPPEAYAAEEPAKPRRKGLFAVVAVFTLAVVGTAGAYAYRSMFSTVPGAPPLIRADSAPNKVSAAQPSESGKQITDRLGTDRVPGERVVSREEQPVDVRTAQSRSTFPSTPNTGNPPPVTAINPGWPSTPGLGSPAPQAATSGGANPQNEPRRIRTIPIRSDQLAAAPQAGEPPQTAPSTAASAPPPPPAPTRVQQPARPATTAAAPAPSANAPLSFNPQSAREPRVPSSRVASAPPSPRAAEAPSGAYVVQIAAHKTQEEASDAFRAAQGKYPDALRGRKLLINKKEIEGRGTFYRAQVGPFASREDATQLCEKLKSAGGTCIVQRN